MESTFNLTVNGKPCRITTDGECPLLDVLREDLDLVGAHYGCGEGECGACGVLIDGQRVFSCITGVGEVDGKSITTIEGLAKGDQLSPVQLAFLDDGAFQCGYCTPGMIVATTALLKRTPAPSDEQIVEAMNGNLCRCCGHVAQLRAIQRAASAVAATGGER